MPKKPKLSEEARKYFREQGRLGGKVGGKKRADSMTPQRRSEIAKKAAATRWKNVAKKAKDQ